MIIADTFVGTTRAGASALARKGYEMTGDSGASADADRAFAAAPSSPQAVSPVPASIPSAVRALGRRAAQAYLDDPRHLSEEYIKNTARDIMDEHFARCHANALAVAKDCLLNMVADARRFDEDIDGDETGMTITYFIETDGGSFGELAEVLGVRSVYGETWGDAILRELRADVASAIEARRAETEGLGAQHESAVPEGQTPNPVSDHPDDISTGQGEK